MSIRSTQSEFVRQVARLIEKGTELGYEFSFGDAYRDPRVHGAVGNKLSYSSSKSKHKERLAIDLNLFKNGEYLSSTEAHRVLGEWWEAQGGVWGGNFRNADGNHYQAGENW